MIHEHVQSATQKKKEVRYIHVQTDIPATRRFRHACCKKQMVENVVNTGLEVVNKVQENFSPSNI